METILYIFISAIFMVIIYSRLKKYGINGYTVFLCITFFAYFLVPTMVFILGEPYQYKYQILGNIYMSTSAERIKVLLYIITFIMFTSIFYKVIRVKECLVNQDSEIILEKIYNITKKYLIVMLIVGGIGFIYMLINLGGVTKVIEYSGVARGEGSYELQSGSILAYSIILARALLGCSFPVIIIYNIKKSKKTFLTLILIMMLASIYLIFNAGRLQIIIFILPIVLYLIGKVTGKKQIVLYICITVGVLWLMPKMDDLFYYINHGTKLSSFKAEWSLSDNIVSLLNAFTYPYSNMLLVDEMNMHYGLRYGVDFIVPFVNIIPNRVLSLIGASDIETLYNLTSSYYVTSVSGIQTSGGVPNDFITLIVRQLSFAAPFVFGAIMGVVLKYIDSSIKILYKLGSKFKHLIYTNCMVIIAFMLLEPNSGIMAYFHIMASMFLTKSIVKITKEYSK